MKEIWIGLVHVKITIRTKLAFNKKAKGAYTNFLTYASSYDDWLMELAKYLEYYSLDLIEVEDVESLRTRKSNYEIPIELNAVIEKLEITGIPQTTVFDTYRNC